MVSPRIWCFEDFPKLAVYIMKIENAIIIYAFANILIVFINEKDHKEVGLYLERLCSYIVAMYNAE